VPAARQVCRRPASGVGYIQRMPGPDLKLAIATELYLALDGIEAPPDLFGIIGSWGDTLTDEEVLEHLRQFNATGSTFEVIDITTPDWRELRCSSCRRRRSETGKLVAGTGRNLFICDQCVAICQEVIEAP
jgi:ClpX C4-type zinc finger